MSFTNKLVLIITLFIGFSSQHVTAKVSVGDSAPEITLPSFKDGTSVSLSDYKGKVVYVDFWASWCKPCLESFPALKAIHKKYHAEGFEILAVNVDMKKHLASEFLAKHPPTYASVHDEKMKVSRAYKINVMPTGFFIDRKGVIRYIHRGFVPGDEKSIEKAVQFLLNES